MSFISIPADVLSGFLTRTDRLISGDCIEAPFQSKRILALPEAADSLGFYLFAETARSAQNTLCAMEATLRRMLI